MVDYRSTIFSMTRVSVNWQDDYKEKIAKKTIDAYSSGC